MKSIGKKKFRELCDFKKKFGSTEVPQNYKEYEDLWSWVFTQRRNYTKRLNGDNSSMTDKRVYALKCIGFIFDLHEEHWNKKFKELVMYRNNHGNSMVPKKHTNYRLVKWVDVQRTQYKNLQCGLHSNLTTERIKKLESIDFVWNVNDFKWQLKYNQLKEFCKINGHCVVPKKGNSLLHNWLKRQRSEYKRMIEGKQTAMNAERVGRLRKIGVTL